MLRQAIRRARGSSAARVSLAASRAPRRHGASMSIGGRGGRRLARHAALTIRGEPLMAGTMLWHGGG